MWSNTEILPKKEDTPVDPCIAAAADLKTFLDFNKAEHLPKI